MSAPEPPFAPVDPELDFPRHERAILELWQRERIFERSLTHRGPDAPHFVFYEGPPTANGLPHNGHVLTRVMKDVFPRYQAMRGHRVLRKGGWDTHGLPVEVEVEKELRIHGKAAIVEHGVEPFVRRCIDSVFRYTHEWERQTERIGFWVSLPDAYVTYHRSYVESVWWALSELFKKGLLYQGHKVVWWWAQGGTALSAAEVGQGYKQVDDPSAYVAFELEAPLPAADGSVEPTALVVWTTTPWTLPSNLFAAVRPGTAYALVEVGEPPTAEADAGPAKGGKGTSPAAPRARGAHRRLVLAEALVPALAAKLGRPLTVLRSLDAAALVGLRYTPPFPAVFHAEHGARTGTLRAGGQAPLFWRVIAEDFVALDTGTGVVHMAPAFGEDDSRAHARDWARFTEGEGTPPPLFSAVNVDGTFNERAPEAWRGRWVKDCDAEILAALAGRGLLVFDEKYTHDYPFCWRADQDPLLQMARPAWFIRTTAELDRAKANNQAVNWLPPHIKDGRFGDFLDHNVDWALSRERFWGTPLNVWECRAMSPQASSPAPGMSPAMSPQASSPAPGMSPAMSPQASSPAPGAGCGHREAPTSVAEILARNPRAFDHWDAAKAADPTLNEHLMVHKPWIDQVTLPCPRCSGTLRRVPEVIDCWFDSGCMPFAQWGFPHQPGSIERFDDAFPADFISEAIDQTRGWFYSLLMVSSLVFDAEAQARLGLSCRRELPHPYKTCIVLGHVCDKTGKKESKSKGNYTPPDIILDRVRMDFAVLDAAPGVDAVPGEALIAREDIEGMDVAEGAAMRLYHPDRPGEWREVTLRAHKRLPRRVVVLAPAEREGLGLTPAPKGVGTRPVEVPDLPAGARVTLEDPSTPAPGADAFRWFFYASSPPWNNTRHSLGNVRLLQKDFLVKLRNVYGFFVIYANIDGWSPRRPEHAGRPVAERALLDRWVLSELSRTTAAVRASLDAFQVYDAALRLVELAESLSNWYVRRSRPRFWAAGLEADKRDAYATLHECLVTLAGLMAPFTPFFADELYQNLVRRPALGGWSGAGPAPRAGQDAAGADAGAPPPPSVHLSDYPAPHPEREDAELSALMAAVREAVSLGLGVRTTGKLKVRQPLARADVVLNDPTLVERLADHRALIAEELNVHEVRLMAGRHEDGAITWKLKPNFRTLGPRLGKNVQAAKAVLEGADAAALVAALGRDGTVTVTVAGEPLTLTAEDVDVSVSAAPGFAAGTGKLGVVVLHTTLTEALVDEGLLREALSRIQAERKAQALAFTDRVTIAFAASERLERVLSAARDHIASECLAVSVEARPDVAAEPQALGDETLRLEVRRATT